METLVVLDYYTCSVLFFELDEEVVNLLEEEYENDSMSWISGTGIDKQFGFNVSNSNWMLVDGELEIYKCSKNGESTRMHLFM